MPIWGSSDFIIVVLSHFSYLLNFKGISCFSAHCFYLIVSGKSGSRPFFPHHQVWESGYQVTTAFSFLLPSNPLHLTSFLYPNLSSASLLLLSLPLFPFSSYPSLPFPFSPPLPLLPSPFPSSSTGEYERVQKKAFTNWVNSHLIKVNHMNFNQSHSLNHVR